jgi:ribbon-helix-helix CopG family protein
MWPAKPGPGELGPPAQSQLYEALYTTSVAATRTQIYLTGQQRQKIDKIVEAEGVSLAEVVRRALDSYLSAAVPDPRSALERTFGALPDLEVPSRDEWDRG